MTVGIITDSICAPSPELSGKLGIKIVPLNVHVGEKVYRDLVDMTPEEIYRLLPGLKEIPTTSAPPETSFREVFQQFLDAGEQLICFTVTSRLSGTYGVAYQALQNLPGKSAERVRIVDTGTGGAAASLLVAEAGRMAREGDPPEEIMAAVNRMLPHCKLLVAVDTLQYLEKSGKVSKLAALAGNIFTIKPIIRLGGGEAVPTGRTRGMRQAVNRILETFHAETAGAERVWAAVTHADAAGEGRRIAGEIKEKYPGITADMVPFTVAMGAHAGPGVLGIGYTYIP